MKEIGYYLFAFIFNICRIFPVSDKKIILYNGHNRGLHGNLLEMQKIFRQEEPKAHFCLFIKQDMFAGKKKTDKIKGAFRFFVIMPFHMATAEYIFLNDNLLPLGHCKPSGKTKIVQLWHGAGAFKKFGLSTENNEAVRKQVVRANEKLTHLFVTSQKVIPYYEEAFCVPEERIYATGIPATDIYTDSSSRQSGVERFYKKYPQLKGKKLLLYTPTFRKSVEENAELTQHFPIEKIHEKLGQDWVILVKLHPKYVSDTVKECEYCYNVTEYPDISDLFFISDLLVTDYSSTIVEYVLLNKPIVLYAFDLKEYDRGFYRDYETTVPGIVAHNEEELLKAVGQSQEESNRRQNFLNMQYDNPDGSAARRVFDVLQK
ncbi:MAG: CDP-glycerol glycerophosphotransferase family protein [Butyribacter sp.]|nr:CDP-glycerol glycerophosphotransferase family protein [bacterium]MDY3853683.1 CDP-glycerol glycerophosphotransferase family protein [Butyribacter sp.]